MFAKVHNRPKPGGGTTRITAICDAELLGHVFTEGEVTIDLSKYRSFYEGERVDEEGAIGLIKAASNINLVGTKTLAAAQKAINVQYGVVKRVKGVPHLQVYQL